MFRAFFASFAFSISASSVMAEPYVQLAQYQVLESENASEQIDEAAPSSDETINETLSTDEPASQEADTAVMVDAPEADAGDTESQPLVEPAEPSAFVDPEYRFSAIKNGADALSVRGHLPNANARSMLRNAVGSYAALSDIEINPAAPQGFIESMLAGLAALEHLDSGQVAYARGAWLLSGYASIDTHKQAALEVIGQLEDAENWRVMITAPKAIDVCRAAVEDYMDGKAILFASGSARLTPDSEALLPDLAKLFEICPESAIYIEGHTDSDGGDAANLVLSVARAEAVADGLIALGLAPDRLYAVGYGASLPIASNATNEGKRQNRRIVFSFEDAAE